MTAAIFFSFCQVFPRLREPNFAPRTLSTIVRPLKAPTLLYSGRWSLAPFPIQHNALKHSWYRRHNYPENYPEHSRGRRRRLSAPSCRTPNPSLSPLVRSGRQPLCSTSPHSRCPRATLRANTWGNPLSGVGNRPDGALPPQAVAAPQGNNPDSPQHPFLQSTRLSFAPS